MRRDYAFFIGCWSGVIGVLFDIDHLIYGIQAGVPFWCTIGHKPAHTYYFALCIVWACFVVALLVGWAGAMVYHAIGCAIAHYKVRK